MIYDGNLTPIDFIISNGNTYYVIGSPSEASDPVNNKGVIPCPTSYSWKLSDVSASDAGRTEDGLMHKKRLSLPAGQKRHLELEWENVYRNEASIIINAFNAEYFQVQFWDILDNAYKLLTFYSGDRESPMYNMALGIQSSVKFNIIQR
jgi:hypothetical protein